MGWIPALLVGLSVGADPSDIAQLSGTWRVTTLVENGKALSAKQIAASYVADQIVTIDGPTISYRTPEMIDPVRRPFVINAKAEPKQIDIIGGEKGREVQGIYGLFGDSLMICLPTADAHAGRPTEFTSQPDSEHVILVLKRVGAAAPAASAPAGVKAVGQATPAAAKPAAPAAPARTPLKAEMLVGTWGHQTDDAVAYTTLNADGTFSTNMSWKSGFKKTFNPDVRSSGTWKLEGGNLLFTINASTSSERRNQIYTFRVVSLEGNEIVTVDGMGRLKRDWKVR